MLHWSANSASFISTRNNNSPRRVPRGPPPGRDLGEDVAPFYLTTMDLPVRNAITIFKSHAGTPISDSFVIRILSNNKAIAIVKKRISHLFHD